MTNLSVKKFRRLLRTKSKSNDFQVFQAIQVNKINGYDGKRNRNPKLDALLQQYHAVFKSELPKGLPPERAVDHEIGIEDGAKLAHRPLFQISPAEMVACKEYILDLQKKGKIRPSRSPFGAPLFFVKNKDKPLRGVVDYRALNRITKRNNAPLPRSDEMFDRLGGATVFSKLDLKTGFHEIRVGRDDIEKNTFNTKYGQFEYLVMAMGLCNAPETFQSLMNRIFYDCIDVFLVVYMDDVLIFSKDEESHLNPTYNFQEDYYHCSTSIVYCTTCRRRKRRSSVAALACADHRAGSIAKINEDVNEKAGRIVQQ